MRSVLAILTILLLGVGAARAESLQLESPAVVILDSTTGEELFARSADEPRPIASMTKIFVAMILRKHRLDLEGWTQITDQDARAAEGGAGTRLLRGESFNNLDLLHAMLLVSDNRVPTALARSVKLSPKQLLAEMNDLAESLGLAHTHFTDVTGILGNESTAREMAIAMTRTLADPVLAKIMRTRYARITSKSQAVTIDYKSTVLPLWTKGLRIRGGKTGTTEAAGHCMLIGATIAKRPVVMAFLGGETASSRFVDFAKAVRWLER
ncbi:MAG: D-alanyl-D-alanine carboxypeptidase [Kofleriaceae bacterium]|nr:D-alanyl-D-alanine carboxypeptidase [Kofleriaceae bacterium]